MGVLAIISMIVNISTLTMLHDQKIIKESVVEYKQVVLATDSQRIQLFIDELLTPKSAACFRAILNRESHMNPLAKNPYSSASGVGQLLSSTYQNLGMRKSSDPLAQVVASLAYISRKFGGASSTCNAWHVWQKQGSY
jgi:hypothetical protein